MSHYLIDYNKYLELCYAILNNVNKVNNKYQAILCPLRGGFFLSYFMAEHLKLPIRYLEISSYTGKEQSEFVIGYVPDLAKGRFLLCDDIYDSGNTINKILEIYKGIEFDIACLVSKQKLSNIFYGEQVEHDRWVDFFWEVM